MVDKFEKQKRKILSCCNEYKYDINDFNVKNEIARIHSDFVYSSKVVNDKFKNICNAERYLYNGHDDVGDIEYERKVSLDSDTFTSVVWSCNQNKIIRVKMCDKIADYMIAVSHVWSDSSFGCKKSECGVKCDDVNEKIFSYFQEIHNLMKSQRWFDENKDVLVWLDVMSIDQKNAFAIRDATYSMSYVYFYADITFVYKGDQRDSLEKWFKSVWTVQETIYSKRLVVSEKGYLRRIRDVRINDIRMIDSTAEAIAELRRREGGMSQDKLYALRHLIPGLKNMPCLYDRTIEEIKFNIIGRYDFDIRELNGLYRRDEEQNTCMMADLCKYTGPQIFVPTKGVRVPIQNIYNKYKNGQTMTDLLNAFGTEKSLKKKISNISQYIVMCQTFIDDVVRMGEENRLCVFMKKFIHEKSIKSEEPWKNITVEATSDNGFLKMVTFLSGIERSFEFANIAGTNYFLGFIFEVEFIYILLMLKLKDGIINDQHFEWAIWQIICKGQSYKDEGYYRARIDITKVGLLKQTDFYLNFNLFVHQLECRKGCDCLRWKNTHTLYINTFCDFQFHYCMFECISVIFTEGVVKVCNLTTCHLDIANFECRDSHHLGYNRGNLYSVHSNVFIGGQNKMTLHERKTLQYYVREHMYVYLDLTIGFSSKFERYLIRRYNMKLKMIKRERFLKILDFLFDMKIYKKRLRMVEQLQYCLDDYRETLSYKVNERSIMFKVNKDIANTINVLNFMSGDRICPNNRSFSKNKEIYNRKVSIVRKLIDCFTKIDNGFFVLNRKGIKMINKHIPVNVDDIYYEQCHVCNSIYNFCVENMIEDIDEISRLDDIYDANNKQFEILNNELSRNCAAKCEAVVGDVEVSNQLKQHKEFDFNKFVFCEIVRFRFKKRKQKSKRNVLVRKYLTKTMHHSRRVVFRKIFKEQNVLKGLGYRYAQKNKIFVYLIMVDRYGDI